MIGSTSAPKSAGARPPARDGGPAAGGSAACFSKNCRRGNCERERKARCSLSQDHSTPSTMTTLNSLRRRLWPCTRRAPQSDRRTVEQIQAAADGMRSWSDGNLRTARRRVASDCPRRFPLRWTGRSRSRPRLGVGSDSPHLGDWPVRRATHGRVGALPGLSAKWLPARARPWSPRSPHSCTRLAVRACT